MSRRRILVVDDEPGMLHAVRRVLERQYELLCAASAEEALALSAATVPDLALLDIRMPGLDGFELARRLKHRHPGIDLIFMTGSLSDADDKLVRAIRHEAFYFIQKPFDRDVLQTLVERALELRTLAERNRAHVQHLEGVLAEAHAFQASLFPRAELNLRGLRIQARRQSCDELCGDFYDYVELGPRRAAFLIADVSGHGASAAMLTGVVKSGFRSCHTAGMAPRDVVERIATGLRSFRANRFVTLFSGLLDTAREELLYVNAGHPPGLLLGASGACTSLDPTGPLISPVFESSRWDQVTLRFDAASRLLLYTDGVVEAPGEEGDYGLPRLQQQLGLAVAQPRLVDAVMQDVLDFMRGRRLVDDLTLLAVDRD